MHSVFEATVVVGLLDTATVTELKEHEVTVSGKKVKGGNNTAVLTDMEVDGVVDWFHHIRPSNEGRIVGEYKVTGKVHFSQDWADYSDVTIISTK